ncbi:MAG: hypothetical protein M3220_22750 [Chloroflexota bacterium]|nr:hypothetical protein [Chloroflexota bacterium]
MHQNWQWDWFLDDWQKAVRRSLIRAFTRRQMMALRWQWRIGQAAKWTLLVLPVLLLLSYLAPEADILLLESFLMWSAFEALLLTVHVGLGVRYNVSYSWAFHHSRPLLLHGMAARLDLKGKALVATVFATFALSCLYVLHR